jgi:hypothetical protein
MNSCWVAFAKAPQDARTLACADGFQWESRTANNKVIAIFGARPRVGNVDGVLRSEAARHPIDL